jgi:TetR/AcrR family transcriptional regulator, transcriptional repressor for nem operon
MSIDIDPGISTRAAGRPREFDIDTALDKAVAVFSERGYHGTAISDLREAMGLTAGSLYKAFKDKRAIFLAAFDRYKQVRNAALDEELELASDGRDGVRRMLAFYAEGAHGHAGRRGCLAVGVAVEMAIFDDEAAARVGRSMDRFEDTFEALIRRGQADGSVSRSIEPKATARLLLTVVQGLRVLGKTSPNREETFSVVDAAMKLLD